MNPKYPPDPKILILLLRSISLLSSIVYSVLLYFSDHNRRLRTRVSPSSSREMGIDKIGNIRIHAAPHPMMSYMDFSFEEMRT